MYDRRWWERTFEERQDATAAAFGPTHPPGTPVGTVVAYDLSWAADYPDLVSPGACCQVFRPDPSEAVATAPQADWLYLTSGLSQPSERGEPWRGVGVVRTDLGDRLSGYGAEFGLLLPDPHPWAAGFLRWLMAYVTTEAVVASGHRVPFGFYDHGGERTYFVGRADELSVAALDGTTATVFGPLLTGPASIVTSTGGFDLLIGTTITADEYAFARQTSTEHLLLLLATAGVGQRSVFGRSSVLADERWSAEADRVGRLNPAEVAAELNGRRRRVRP